MKRIASVLAVTAMLACYAYAAEGIRIVTMNEGGKTQTALATNLVAETIAAEPALMRGTAGLTNLANIGIQSGTITAAADGSKTNTFTTAFSAAPNVLVVQTGVDTTITNSITITASNFVWTCNKASQTGRWIAIGTP